MINQSKRSDGSMVNNSSVIAPKCLIDGVGILMTGDSAEIGGTFKGTGFVVFSGKYVLTSAHSLLPFSNASQLQPKSFHMRDKNQYLSQLRIKNWIICKEWKTYILSQLDNDLKMGIKDKDINEKLFHYDYALLELQDYLKQSIIELEVCSEKDFKEKQVMVYGYSSKQEVNGGKAVASVGGGGTRLIYNNITKGGNSGSPVIAEINGKKKAIGLHKCAISEISQSAGILITQSIYDELLLMKQNLQKWQNIEPFIWEMKNNSLYKFYDVNSNTIVRTKAQNPKFILLTSINPLDQEKTHIYTFSLRYNDFSAISFGVVDEKLRFNEFKSFQDTSACHGMVTFTSIFSKYKQSSKIYECGSNVSGAGQKFPALQMIKTNFEEEVEMVVNLQANKRNIIWRVKDKDEMKVILSPQQFPITSKLHLFVSMPKECRVRVRKTF